MCVSGSKSHDLQGNCIDPNKARISDPHVAVERLWRGHERHPNSSHNNLKDGRATCANTDATDAGANLNAPHVSEW